MNRPLTVRKKGEMPSQPWRPRLADLLAGRPPTADPHGASGAELIVSNPGERQEAFRAPLARHHRIDDDDPHLIWIRPITGGYAPADPASGIDYAYNLNQARRRSLAYTTVHLDGDDVVFDLQTGQRARITPAAGEARAELWRWDDFVDHVLTEDEAADLAQLREDSWQGRFG